jgi:hypothetical protein
MSKFLKYLGEVMKLLRGIEIQKFYTNETNIIFIKRLLLIAVSSSSLMLSGCECAWITSEFVCG